MSKEKTNSAILVVLIAGILWSFGALVVRYIEDARSIPWQYLFFRGLTIFLLLNLYLFIKEGKSFVNNYKKIDLSVIILTYNEALHIKRCINSVKKFVREVIVIDSHSTDNTLNICKKLKVRIYKNKFINQARQMNWALKNINIKSKWIFRLDADEFIEKDSLNKIRDIIKFNNTISGVIVERKVKFLNKIINYGLTSPHKTLRIWKTGKGKYPILEVDEQVKIKGRVFISDSIIVDNNLKSFKWWINKHMNYSQREAISYLKFKNKKNLFVSKDAVNKRNKYKIYYNFPILIRPLILFIYAYLFKLGFLSGWQGLIYNLFQILWYRLLVDIKIIQLSK